MGSAFGCACAVYGDGIPSISQRRAIAQAAFVAFVYGGPPLLMRGTRSRMKRASSELETREGGRGCCVSMSLCACRMTPLHRCAANPRDAIGAVSGQDRHAREQSRATMGSGMQNEVTPMHLSESRGLRRFRHTFQWEGIHNVTARERAKDREWSLPTFT